MEIAFISANKLKLELEKNQTGLTAKIIAIFSNNPSRFIATMLVGNNIALVVYGIEMAAILKAPLSIFFNNIESYVLIAQTLIATILILITAEFLPKATFRIAPNFSLNIFAFPTYIFYILLYLIVSFVLFLSNRFLKIFGIKIEKGKESMTYGKIDLGDLIETSSVEIGEEIKVDNELKIFQNVLDFSKVKLRDCMVPRNEIEALDINESINTLKQNFIHTGYSKILIYKETIDNIVGYVHSFELFKNPKTIKNMLFDLIFVPETMHAKKLLENFIKEKKSIAVVVDEFGGTSGIVTIEDIIEEIFGEIEDEHDLIELSEQKINQNEFEFSGRLEIDYINEKYNIEIPISEEYETLAGLILFYNEDIPGENQVIKVEDVNTFIFKIKKATSTKIELINLIIK